MQRPQKPGVPLKHQCPERSPQLLVAVSQPVMLLLMLLAVWTMIGRLRTSRTVNRHTFFRTQVLHGNVCVQGLVCCFSCGGVCILTCCSDMLRCCGCCLLSGSLED